MRDGAKTRERICEAALALFASKGVDGATVRDIAQAVGVSEGALYRHFRSKEEIARDIFATRYAALARDVLEIGIGEGGLESRIGALTRRFTTLFDEEPALFAFLLVNQHQHLGEVSGAAAENPVEALRAVFEEAIRRGEIEPDDPDLLAAMALGLVVQPAVFSIYKRLPAPLGRYAPQITRALMATLRPT